MRLYFILKIIIISIFCTFLFLSVPLDADFGWSDAGHHAIDGVFYKDLIMDAGFLNPVEYAKTYYQHYPAITPVMYPPFFGLTEALFFSILGIHAWAARAAVIFFYALGAWGITLLTKELLGKAGSLFAGLIYMSFPIVLYWSRDVMLEPAAMALVIWSFYGFLYYLKYSCIKGIYICLVCATLAPYTKQNTIFIFPVFILSAVISGRAARLFDRRFLSGICISAFCGIPLIYVTLGWGTLNLAQSFGSMKEYQSFFDHAFFYIFSLPESLGWPVLLLSGLGAFSAVQKFYRIKCTNKKDSCTELDNNKKYCGKQKKKLLKKLKYKWIFLFKTWPESALFISWAVICYLQMAVIQIKEPRHGFFWLPLFAVLSALGLKKVLFHFILREQHAAFIGCTMVIILFSYNLNQCKMNWSGGFREAAVYLTQNWKGNGILTNVTGDSSLIFHIRALDRHRRYRVYRCLKVFESMMIYKRWHQKTLLHSQEEFLNAISEWDVKYVLIEEPMKHPTAAESIIREAVKRSEFVQVKIFPVVYPRFMHAKLYLYRYLGNSVKNPSVPDIYLPVVGQVIRGN